MRTRLTKPDGFANTFSRCPLFLFAPFLNGHLFFSYLFVHLLLVRYSQTERNTSQVLRPLRLPSPLSSPRHPSSKPSSRIFRSSFRMWILSSSSRYILLLLLLFFFFFFLARSSSCARVSCFPLKSLSFPAQNRNKNKKRDTHTRTHARAVVYTNGGDFALQRHRSNDRHHREDLCFEERVVVQS